MLAVLALAVASDRARAQSLLEIAAGLKFCKTLTDDAQRLKCFDSLFAKKEEPPAEKPQTETAMGWKVEESKSPVDDSPQVTALLHADGSTEGVSLTPPIMLVLRCQEKKTEAYFAKPFAFLGTNPIKTLVRINDGKAIETQWHPASNGQGVFAPAAVQFIRALPDNGKLFIRATGFNGETIDGVFSLGKVSEIRDKIAADCHWMANTPPPQAEKKL
jgi:hypothetical protein